MSSNRIINVLHVDNDESFLELTKQFFYKINKQIKITQITTVKDALDTLSRNNDFYDVIISEYEMPNKTGLELLSEIRRMPNLIDISFIILTKQSREEIIIQSLNSGVDNYLQKDGESKVLFAKLNHFMLRVLDQKKAQMALKQSEFRFRSMVEQNPFSTVVYFPDGTPITSNIAMAKLWNLSDEEMTYLTANYNIFKDPQLINKGLMPYIKKGFAGEPTTLPTIRYDPQEAEDLKPEKTKPLWIRSYLYPVKDINGVVQQVVLIQENVTDQKIYEDHLRRQKEELSDFAHAMAHDIGNSILSIRGFAQLLNIEFKKDYVDKIITGTKYITTILNRSLTLAIEGLVIGEKELVDLNQIIETTVSNIIPPNVEFSKDSLPSVLGDRERIYQIFSNLIENAIVHGDPSQIRIKTKNSPKNRFIDIINDGKPIPKRHGKKIFQKGYSTRNGGMGLGLSIVQKLVEAHGWEISLQSSKETTFRICIPL